jgi:hypothetical protein
VGVTFFGVAVDPAPEEPGAPAATVAAVLGPGPLPGPDSTLQEMVDPQDGVVGAAAIGGRLLFLDLAVDEGTAEVIRIRWPGRDVHLLAVPGVVDACSYRWWRADGSLARALDVDASSGAVERDEGERLPEEVGVWAAAGAGVPSGEALGLALSRRLLGARLDELPDRVRRTVVPTWTAARSTAPAAPPRPQPTRTAPEPPSGRAAPATPNRAGFVVIASVLALVVAILLVALLVLT